MNTARSRLFIWAKFVSAAAIDLRKYTRATNASIVGDTAANRRHQALESLIAVVDDMNEAAQLEPSVERNLYPGITKHHISALKSLVVDARQRAIGVDNQRWPYYAPGGWGGDRLTEMLEFLGSPLEENVV